MCLRRPRLMVLLTDTCANVPGKKVLNHTTTPSPAKRSAGPPAEIPVAGDGPVLRHLLLRPQGVVDVNAARTGFYSWGDALTGDYFTRALANLLNQPASHFTGGKSRPVVWSDFYRALDAEAYRIAAGHRTYQMAQAFSLPGVLR
jgi:hypothetical protein